MSKQLLFYTSATPVSAQRHKGWGVEPRDDYAFAAETNSVPLMAIEFAALLHHLHGFPHDDLADPVHCLVSAQRFSLKALQG